MERERDFEHFTTDELVEQYLAIPFHARPDIEELPENPAPEIHSFFSRPSSLFELLTQGLLNPGEVADAIQTDSQALATKHPELKKSIQFVSYLYQAESWIAHSIYLTSHITDINGNHTVNQLPNDLIKAQENSARLFLMAELSVNTRTPLYSKYILTGLINARQATLARKIAQTFGAVILTNNDEENQLLAQILGETNPTNIKNGIATNAKIPPNSGSN